MAKLASRSVLGCGEAYLIGEIALGAMVGQVKRAHIWAHAIITCLLTGPS
jgi:hypothetical protein